MTAVKTTSTFVLVRDEHSFKEVPLLTVPVSMVYGSMKDVRLVFVLIEKNCRKDSFETLAMFGNAGGRF